MKNLLLLFAMILAHSINIYAQSNRLMIRDSLSNGRHCLTYNLSLTDNAEECSSFNINEIAISKLSSIEIENSLDKTASPTCIAMSPNLEIMTKNCSHTTFDWRVDKYFEWNDSSFERLFRFRPAKSPNLCMAIDINRNTLILDICNRGNHNQIFRSI